MVNVTISGDKKPWYTSKTLIVGVITLILGVLDVTQGNIASGIPVTTMSIIMIVLRLITSGKIKFLD